MKNYMKLVNLKGSMKLFFKIIFKSLFPLMFSWFQLYRYEKRILPTEFINHLNKLNSSNLVIDIGANVGLVSEILAKRGCRVIAFEPNTSAFEKLKIVAQKYSNIDIRKEAAGIKNQQIKLFLHKNSDHTDQDLTQASSLISEKPNVSSENFEFVKEIDFAQFLKSFDEPIELIKIDIEGYEIQLLNHLIDENAISNINYFYIETHERKFVDLTIPTAKLKTRIKKEGYEDKFFFDWH